MCFRIWQLARLYRGFDFSTNAPMDTKLLSIMRPNKLFPREHVLYYPLLDPFFIAAQLIDLN